MQKPSVSEVEALRVGFVVNLAYVGWVRLKCMKISEITLIHSCLEQRRQQAPSPVCHSLFSFLSSGGS